MSAKTVEMTLMAWRKLERELDSAGEEDREELHARIRELRDRYRSLVSDVEGHSVTADPDQARSSPGTASDLREGLGSARP